MKETWKTYRITWLLYIGLIVLPLVFSLSIGQLKSLDSDTRTIRQLANVGGDMLLYSISKDPIATEKYRRVVTRELSQLSRWFKTVKNGTFYVGSGSPMQDFNALGTCWETLLKNRTIRQGVLCRENARALSFSVERMIALEIDHMRTVLYMTLAGGMLFLLLLILFVREYIRHQLRKQAVTDAETGLFNRKYFEVSLHKHCARAKRFGHPLTLLELQVEGMDSVLSKEEKARFLQRIGSLMHTLFRASDTVCRYSESGYVAIMPDTPTEGAAIVEKRLHDRLLKTLEEEYPGIGGRFRIIDQPAESDCEPFFRKALGLPAERETA